MKRVLWFEDAAAPAAVAALEAAWLSLWLAWLGRLPGFLPYTGGTLLPFWGAFGLVLGGHVAGRLSLGANGEPGRKPNGAQGRTWRLDPAQLRRARLMVAGAGLLAVTGALWLVYGRGAPPGTLTWLVEIARALAVSWRPVPPQALTLLAAMYLWRRGLQTSRVAASEAHTDLRRTFYTGLAGMALAVLAAAPEPGRASARLTAGEIAGTALIYFAVGLSALALSSAQRAMREGAGLAGARVTLNRYWLGASVAVIVCVLLGGLVAGWLVTPEPIRAIFAALAPLVNVAGAALLLALAGVAAGVLLIAQMIAPLIWRLLMAVTRLPLPETPPMEPPDFGALVQQVNQWMERAPAVRLALNVLAVVLLLGGIGFIFWLALERLGRRRDASEAELRESIASRDLIIRQLRGLFNRLRPGLEGGRPYLRLDGPPLDPRRVVRQAYQAMLAWAAETLQEPRAPGQTPTAYAVRLAAREPQAGPALAVLTAAYLKARYSAQPPSPAEAEAARRAAAQIRQTRQRG